MQFGSLHDNAHELRIQQWIDGQGRKSPPLTLDDLGDGYKIIYCFQHWCPGCHSRGFPTLKYLSDNLSDKGFGFAAVQTAFEGSEVNTFDKLRVNQTQYALEIPFGHDVPIGNDQYPSFMADYRSGGTPWFTIIDPDNNVVYGDFRIDPNKFLLALGADAVDLIKD